MITVGVLGTGFGKHHLSIYQKMPEVTVVAVFGRNQDTLHKLHSEYSVDTTANLDEIIANPEIDLIDICLPTLMHSDTAIKALDSGKHVFCETPVTFSSEEAKEVQRAAQTNNRCVYVDLFTKFSAPHQIGIEYVKSGKIGTLTHLYTYNKTSPVWGDLSLDKSLMNFFIHNIDMMLEIAGMPKKVHAFGVDQNSKSVIEANYGYDGSMATIISDASLPRNSPFLIGYDIIGDLGSLRFNASFGDQTHQKLVYNDGSNNIELEIPGTDDYEEVTKHVLASALENTQSEKVDISHAIDALIVAEKTRENMRIF